MIGAVPVHTPVVPVSCCPIFSVPVTAGAVVAPSTGGARTPSLATLKAACVFPEAVAVTSAATACPTSAATGMYVAIEAPAIGLQMRPFALQRSQTYDPDAVVDVHVPAVTLRV